MCLNKNMSGYRIRTLHFASEV